MSRYDRTRQLSTTYAFKSDLAKWVHPAMNFFFLLLAMVGFVVVYLKFQFLVDQLLDRWLMPLLFRGLRRLNIGPSITPWLFEPISEFDLPRPQRTFFELHSAAFVRLGFKPLGDFVLRRDPAPSCSRFFLSPCGTIVGALSHYLDNRFIMCKSITRDGLYLETSNVEVDSPPIEHGLQLFWLRSNDPSAIVDVHRSEARLAATRRQSELATIVPAELQTVMQYGHNLWLRSLHREGVLPELPAFLQEQDLVQAGGT